MSRPIMQGKITVLEAHGTETHDEWVVTVDFREQEGLFTTASLEAGDFLVIDTTVYEPGTLTRYEILDIVTQNFQTPTIRIKYRPDNDNLDPNPDLSWMVGAEGIFARPSPNHKLVPVPSPSIQMLSDKYSFYLLNYNLTYIVDQFLGGGSNVELFTLKREPLRPGGYVVLPHPPLGDFLLNMCYLHLQNGTVVELLDIEYSVVGVEHRLVLPTEDYLLFEDSAETVTVSYLINV